MPNSGIVLTYPNDIFLTTDIGLYLSILVSVQLLLLQDRIIIILLTYENIVCAGGNSQIYSLIN